MHDGCLFLQSVQSVDPAWSGEYSTGSRQRPCSMNRDQNTTCIYSQPPNWLGAGAQGAYRQLDVQRKQAHTRGKLPDEPLQVRHALPARPASRSSKSTARHKRVDT